MLESFDIGGLLFLTRFIDGFIWKVLSHVKEKMSPSLQEVYKQKDTHKWGVDERDRF